MSIEPVALADIEQAVLDRLRQRILQDGDGLRVEEFDIGRDFEDLIWPVQVAAAVEEIDPIRRVCDGTYNCRFTLSLYAAFKSVRSERDRRHGVYPMVQGIALILSGQTLGLDIEPLSVGRAQELFHPTLHSKGYIGFKIPVSTDFDFEAQQPEDLGTALLIIGLNFYMQPDDGQVDAQNLISVRE
jgi:hypothetical protein